MINSVNTLEFLKPKLINMDKFNSSSTTSRIHHPISHTPTRSFYTFVTNSSESVNPTLMIASDHQVHLQHQQSSLRQERVKVQHLENHTKLQNNNCWSNFRTLISASPCAIVGDSDAVCQDILRPDREYELDVDDMQHLQNRSAFTLELKNNNIYSNICNNNNNNIIRKMTNEDCQSESLSPIETNNNHLFYKHHQKNGFINKQQPQPKTMMVILPRRTEDQEHAYRRIESVHNYAKLKSYDDEVADTQSPNGSRHSSNYLDDEEEEDDDEEDDEEDDYNNDADYDVEEDEMIDLDGDYEDIFNRRRYPKLSTSSADGGAIISPKLATKKSHYKCMTSQQKSQSSHKNTDDGTDLHIDIDVETVENPITNTMAMINSNDSATVKPDHHARRPMNAFLIFCKRHRAIVKERYKTLENRAITKILGDWWASLDANDKKCFTSLAQQNKDAFFSANPNFKWYKLPAPPLRTLNTRPSNFNIPGSDTLEYDDNSFAVIESISNNTRSNTNYFKLADEAQMGDLSQLMQDKSKIKQCALQQALGETSQFMRSHITGPLEESIRTDEKQQQQQLKRRFYNENSFSSNSSEEDALVPKKKSARSCKGKIYQELINSGQIAAPAIKKSKSTSRMASVETSPNNSVELKRNSEDMNLVNINNSITAGRIQKAAVSESDNILSFGLNSFDLEEKIRELPALSLDDYLQRKRNTKKKKKFTTNGKKRANRCSNLNNNSSGASQSCDNRTSALSVAAQANVATPVSITDCRTIQQRKQQQAVGSQKRKARKESITRRDVSAIEQEVASLLPLTINGCCYFQEAHLPISPVITSNKTVTAEKDTNSPTNSAAIEYLKPPLSPIIPLQTTRMAAPFPCQPSTQETSPPQSLPQTPEVKASVGDLMNNTLNDNIISSTSDLLILAEVAANRTELKH